MSKRAISATPVLTPHTRALLVFEQNLDGMEAMLTLTKYQTVLMTAAAAQAARVGATFPKERNEIATKPGQAKLVRSLNRLTRSLKALEIRIEGFHTIMLWQVVMLVTCVEAYLQDVLSTAAGVDPKLMSKSEQRALYSDVIVATSLEALANDMRARWARGWVDDGGPSGWIERLGKMGARGYPNDLGPRLERFWGIRHVVVHAAGVATADFVKRHPGVVKAAGNPVRVNHHEFLRFVHAVKDFIEPTDGFFLARCPSMLVTAATDPAKGK